MEVLTTHDLRLLEISLINLLELYTELEIPEDGGKAVLAIEKLKDKLHIINNENGQM